MATTRIKLDGPIFGPGAAEAAKEFTDALALEVAQVGRDWIKIEAHGFDRSGRGGTGAAAEGVELAGQGPNWVIRGGIRQGQYSWPWLEGTSPRNRSTGFKGYKTFRRTRLRMRRQVTPYAQDLWNRFANAFGGEPG